jgi:hypothetical protein
MLVNNLRALATALVLGTATIAVAGIATTIPAEAALRSAVGKPLQEAKSLAAAGNYGAAMARVHAAESVGGLTGEERSVISQMKEYIAVKQGGSGDANTALGAKAKFANDYRAGRYSSVVADGDLLRKFGALDSASMRVIAQAYYQMHNYSGCLRYIRETIGYGGASQLALACAAESGDAEATRDLMRAVVLSSPTPENWSRLLRSAESARGLGDHETLDIYRLKNLTGTLSSSKPDDYALLAQLAIQFGSFAEAQAVTQKGFDTKVLQGDRWTRLLNLAKTQNGAAQANLAKNIASARKEKRGDSLIRLGEYLTGGGKAQDGIGLIQAGIAKGVTDVGNAKLRLGVAQLMAGQRDAANRTFNSVNETPNQKAIAQIWSLYARTGK